MVLIGVNRSSVAVPPPAPAHRSDQPLHRPPAVAPRLRTPSRLPALLRRWSNADGQDWLHVQRSLEINVVAGSAPEAVLVGWGDPGPGRA